MPFIEQKKRELVDQDVRLAEAPGDLCYFFYKKFMIEWAKEPRWTTAHNLYKHYIVQSDHLFELSKIKYTRADVITALHLAWQVFFVMKVVPYEEEKIEENGDIQ